MIKMNDTLDQILTKNDNTWFASTGPVAPPDAVLEQTLRDFIQLQSNTIAIATDLVGTRSVPWLEFKWYTGVNGTFTYPIDDAAVVDPTKVGTANYTVKLEKGQGRVVFLDTVRLRGESFENIDRQQLGIVRARADLIDNHILTKLHGGAGQSAAATAVFGSGSADEEGDILGMMDLLFANARVSGDEGVSLVLPADKRSAILNTTLYGNVVESLGEHLRRIANVSILYTRDYGSSSALGNDALLLIPGSETAEFFTYNGAGFQETELTRLPGVGFDWLLTGYMGTVIHEHQDGASSGTNNRIVKLTGVRS
jgi:hypothetical protein|tara:strand:+ start:1942 stop:2874 length:933 start_codon:yes stop_codon:yes gene_type:complete